MSYAVHAITPQILLAAGKSLIIMLVHRLPFRELSVNKENPTLTEYFPFVFSRKYVPNKII